MRPLTAADVEQMITAAMAADNWATVTHLEPQLDQLDQPKTPVPTLSAALWYAEQNLRVFPLQPGLKIPYKGTRGLLDATTDPQIIREWWKFRPDSNVAIATGHLVDVIDIDGPAGVTSWARMTNLPPTLGIVSTPRDGGHHLYVTTTGRGNKAAIFPGIDYRGLGGYVVAPPSVNETGVRYRWRRPLNLTADAVA